MVYSSCVLKCIFAVCVLEVVLHVVGHNTKYKIDEFIDKLLISQKFDQLAEKIAEKAVEKIMNLQPNLRITDGTTNDENGNKTNDITQKQEIQESALPNVEQNDLYKNRTSNETHSDYQRKSTSRKHLSLKYKHFTKGPPFEKNSDEYIDSKTKKRDESNSDVSTEVKNKSQSNESKANPDTEIKQNKIENSNMKTMDAHKIREKTHDESDEDTHNYSNERDGSISIENKKNILEMLIESGSDDHKSYSDIHKYGDKSDFDTKLERDKHLFENDSRHSSKEKKSKKKYKKRVHSEGKRVYTFVSSSDYDEYHRELDREEKERTVFI